MTTAVMPAISTQTKDPPSTTQRIPMSYEAYLEFASEGQLIEWVNGEALIMPSPNPEHQRLLRFLSTLLDLFVNYFALGEVFYAPMTVKLWENGPARQPDLLIVASNQSQQMTSKRFEGAPALAVEIVSPSSVTEDYQRKYAEYEQAGVREYWLIDPRPYQEHADFFALNEDGVYEPVPLDEHGRFFSTVLPHFWLDVNWLRQNPLPNAQRQFAQIMFSHPHLEASTRELYQKLYDQFD